MSNVIDSEKSFVRINDIGNLPNKTIDEIKKNEMSADLHRLKLIKKAHLQKQPPEVFCEKGCS